MRTGIYITLLLLFTITAAKAQKPLTMTDDSVKFGNTMCPGVWVDIPEVSLETVRSEWKKVVEKGTKSNALVTGNEITIFGAVLKDISDVPVNIFSAVETHDSLVRLFSAVELSRDVFTKVNSKEHEQLKKALKQFAKDQYEKVAEDQLSTEETKLKDLEKELSSVKKEKEKLEKEIQSANTTISEENYKLASVKKAMEVTDADLDRKSTELSTMGDGDAKKALQSEVKDLQKAKKTQLKDIESSESKISKSNTLIEDNNKSIAENLKKQEASVEKINNQKLVVDKFTQKLKTIESY
ncbi:MAG: hypothetical protein HGA37_13800 [Lentimicrobium sp.]|nr:hypothetical protein [Lentimicrobium sp.]